LLLENPLPNSAVRRAASSLKISFPYCARSLLLLFDDSTADLVIGVDLKKVNASGHGLAGRKDESTDAIIKSLGLGLITHTRPV
jgi:hypothetical protein